MKFEIESVTRTELRSNQRALLKRVQGQRALHVKGHSPEDEKVVLDKRDFDDLLRRLEGFIETMEITMDRKLFSQILAIVPDQLEEDLRLGKLHSLGDAFAE